MSKVEIFSATSTTEAHLVQGLLAQFDIEAEITGHYLQGGFGELPVADMIRLIVEKHAELRAKDVIERYERGEFIQEDEDEQT